MVPILLMQVILIPAAVSWMMDTWTIRRRETALQDVASHIGSTMQQLYFSLNREGVVPGTVTQAANVPRFIESIPYSITASEKKIENSTMIDLYLALTGINITTTTRVTLGPNVIWEESTFVSNSTSASIKAERFSNGTISFSFG
ncbi:MAG: hypothetical protein JSV51_00370 [Candidatus Bathyarchaeota archaeon]|nr:MAG: hypothetical protein JSV51_00370 [Candidatus Bathyarchaeota archaeon]